MTAEQAEKLLKYLEFCKGNLEWHFWTNAATADLTSVSNIRARAQLDLIVDALTWAGLDSPP